MFNKIINIIKKKKNNVDTHNETIIYCLVVLINYGSQNLK